MTKSTQTHWSAAAAPHRTASRSFTLTELLVVMGVMAVLAGLTVVGYRSISKDAKLSSGKNTVMAVLDNARAMAMKNNRSTMVMFIPRLDNGEQRVEAVVASWAGDILEQRVIVPSSPCFGGSDNSRTFERFVVVNGIKPRRLPEGISIAGPDYNTCNSDDNKWYVPTNLADPKEAGGRALAVLYAPDGTTLSAVASTATASNNYPFVDFDNDGVQYRFITTIAGGTDQYLIDNYFIQVVDTNGPLTHPADEPCAQLVPFMAVFDEEQARKLYDTSKWNDPVTRQADLSNYINSNADRIHFNRYTGVAMK